MLHFLSFIINNKLVKKLSAKKPWNYDYQIITEAPELIPKSEVLPAADALFALPW